MFFDFVLAYKLICTEWQRETRQFCIKSVLYHFWCLLKFDAILTNRTIHFYVEPEVIALCILDILGLLGLLSNFQKVRVL